MSTSAKAGRASDVNIETRIIRALYPQQCLDQSIQPSIAGQSKSPCTYQNTGVQTLPPPNGDVFKIIHGREPSQADYVRNMGTAALGRFGESPRSNSFELIHGTAYCAPATREGRSHVDSSFQTTGGDLTRKALARAKVKASIMVSRYREVARKAGYRVFAESKDNMIAHSEQFPSTVRLDAGGTLLEGSVESLSLPNIRGIPIQPQVQPRQGISTVTRTQYCGVMEENDQRTLKDSARYTSSLHASSPMPQQMLSERITNVPALAPSSGEHTCGTSQVYDDEFGSVGSNTHEFVVYDAGAPEHPPTLTATTTSIAVLQKRKVGSEQQTSTRSKRSKVFTPVRLEGNFTPIMPSPGPPLAALRKDSSHLGTTSSPDNDETHTSSMRHIRSDSGDDNRGHTLNHSNMTKVGTQECNASYETKIKEPITNISSRWIASSPTPALEGQVPTKHSYLKELLPSHLDSAELSTLRSVSTSIEELSKGPTAKTRTPTNASRLSDVSSQERYTDDIDAQFQREPSFMNPIALIADSASLVMDRYVSRNEPRRQSRDTQLTQYNPDDSRDNDNLLLNDMYSLRSSKDPTIRSTSSGGQVKSDQAQKAHDSRTARKPRRPFTPYVPPAMRTKSLQASNDDKARK